MSTQITRSGAETQLRETARRAAEELAAESEVPTLLLCGKTGAGKSSLLNAMMGALVQEIGVAPTTEEPRAIPFDDELTLRAIDVPGFGEADAHEAHLETMVAHLDQAHLALVVVGFPDRALDHESAFLQALRRRFGGPEAYPVLLIPNKIDLAPPARDWDPSTFQLDDPSSNKARALSPWLDHIEASLCRVVTPRAIVPCAAGEGWTDTAHQYGITALQDAIYTALPDAAKRYFARLLRDEAIRDREARRIVLTHTAAAAAATAQPIPALPDAVLIAPVQVKMILALASIYGADPEALDPVKLLGPVMASVGGPMAFHQLSKLVPGWGSVLGASVAGTITLSLGEAYHQLLKAGILAPTTGQVLSAFAEAWQLRTSR
ncbi:MAG TPA: DUF697 domain-containing protein [Deltaproteobacteria bacterium]|nr:DUF697 domain-containing protein [Deltaproteobacteria bacterium]